jgi:hypothetical protein
MLIIFTFFHIPFMSIEFCKWVEGEQHLFLKIGTDVAKKIVKCAALKEFQISLEKL